MEGREVGALKGEADLPGQRVQLHRALSKLGIGSRQQARLWIRAGEVEVDGRVVTDPLTWVDLGRQRVTRRGQAPSRREHCTLALHKPRGILTTRSDERGRPTAYDLLPGGLPYVFAVGRLDADSEGLLIFTSDATLAERLTDPVHHVPRTYRVNVTGIPDPGTLDRLRQGVELHDGPTRPARVRLVRNRATTATLEIVLTEGRNRQIRRMLASVGHRVRRLVRTAIGDLELGALEQGECRILTEPEIGQLMGPGRGQ